MKIAGGNPKAKSKVFLSSSSSVSLGIVTISRLIPEYIHHDANVLQGKEIIYTYNAIYLSGIQHKGIESTPPPPRRIQPLQKCYLLSLA